MTKRTESSLVFWIFLAPVLFAFIMVMVIPFFLGSYYAFTNWSSSARVDGGLRFVGLQNFMESFRDPAFLYSFSITFAYTILNMIAINVVAFALALLVTGELRLKNVYRVGFFVPNLIGGLILGYIWQFIFNNAIPSLGRIIPVLGRTSIYGDYVFDACEFLQTVRCECLADERRPFDHADGAADSWH